MKRYGPKVLIAGCGYLGFPLAHSFHLGGFDPVGITASPKNAGANGNAPFPMNVADITRRETLTPYANRFDCVVVCVSTRGGSAASYRRLYFEGTRNLLEVVRPSKILFVSSTSVYGDAGGDWVDETSVAEPDSATAAVLHETEQLVLAHGGLVARLGGLYGPGRSVHLRRFFDGTAAIENGGNRFINQVHRDDAAGALFLLVAWHAPSGIYNVVDDTPLRQRELYGWLAHVFQRPMPPSEPANPLRRRRSGGNKRVSNAKLHGVGWRCRYPSFQTAALDIAPTLQQPPELSRALLLSAVA